jgi:hypothetical protein
MKGFLLSRLIRDNADHETRHDDRPPAGRPVEVRVVDHRSRPIEAAITFGPYPHTLQ